MVLELQTVEDYFGGAEDGTQVPRKSSYSLNDWTTLLHQLSFSIFGFVVANIVNSRHPVQLYYEKLYIFYSVGVADIALVWALAWSVCVA